MMSKKMERGWIIEETNKAIANRDNGRRLREVYIPLTFVL